MSKARNLGVVVAGYVTSAAVWLQIQGPLASDKFLPFILLALPTAAGAVSLLLGSLLERDKVQPGDELSAETCERIVSRLVRYMIVLHAIIVCGLLGPATWMFRMVLLAVGGTLIGIGNLLPRTRPNSVIGIRTARSLANRLTWIRLHRVTGRITVGAGLGIAVAAFLPLPSADYLFTLIPVAAFGLFTAYLLKLTRKRPGH